MTERNQRGAVRGGVVAVCGAALLAGVIAGIVPMLGASSKVTALRVDDERSVTHLDLPVARDGATKSRAELLATIAGESARPATASHDPRTAVDIFLRAQQARDFVRSYGLVSRGDHQLFRTAGAWTQFQGRLPELSAHRIVSVRTGANQSAVAARLTQKAELDETIGLVAEHAAGSYVAVAEDHGWRVAFALSSVRQLYLSDTTAAVAARAWVAGRVACHSEGRWTSQWAGGFYGAGATGRAQQLCGARGATRLGITSSLGDRADSPAFVAAFGPQVGLWARVIPVIAPRPLDVVLAPIGERWLVIGALQASPEGSG